MSVSKSFVAAVAAAALALSLSACAPSGPTPAQVADAQQMEADAAAEREAQEADLLRLTESTWQEFAAESADLKRAYAVSAILDRADAHQVSLADQGTLMPITMEYPLTGEGEVVNLDGQAILNNWHYAIEDARMQRNEDGTLDYDEAIKTLSAAFYLTGEDGTATDAYAETRDDILGQPKPYVVSDTMLTVYGETPIADGVDSAGDAIKFKDLSYSTQSGENFTARFAYVEMEPLGPEGFPWEYWLLVERQPA
jgi:hypothetical protein